MKILTLITILLLAFVLNACGKKTSDFIGTEIKITETSCTSTLLVKFTGGKCLVFEAVEIILEQGDFNYTYVNNSLAIDGTGSVYVRVL